MAAMLGMDRTKLPALVTRSTCALLLLAQTRRIRLEQQVVGSLRRCDLVHYLEFAQYDETPLPAKVTGASSAEAVLVGSHRLSSPTLALQNNESAGVVCRVDATKSLSVKVAHGPAKIIQTRQEVAMILRLGSKLATVFYRSVTPLGIVETTSANCLKRHQLSVSQATRASAAFVDRTRAATTDAHPSNTLAEKCIAVERGGSDSNSLHVLCQIHATAGIYGKTFAALDPQITGLIRVALSLRNGSAMSRFRACLRDEVASRLRILEGHPSEEAVQYKRDLLMLFVAHGAAVTTRRALLVLCPNGDWRSKYIEYYIQRGGARRLTEREAIVEHVTAGLMVALASAQPALYNRSKWTGADLAVDDLGVFEGVHRLLSTTYARFCASYVSGPRALQFLQMAESLSVYDQTSLLAMEDQTSCQSSVAGAAAVPDEPVTILPEDAKSDKDQNWAKQNSADRSAGFSFIRNSPLAWLVLMRVLMEPLRQFLDRQFHRASSAWEQSQQARAASAAMRGEPVRRAYRLSEIAAGRDNEHFFEQVKTAFSSSDLWRVMPPSFNTFEKRALAFRLLSRMACAFQRLVAGPQKRFPILLFLLLIDPTADLPLSECLWDAWSLSLRKRFPKLNEPELFQILIAVASRMPVDISHIESLNASLRRFLYSRSLQTHAMTVSDLSGQWLSQQHRSLSRTLCTECHPVNTKDAKAKVTHRDEMKHRKRKNDAAPKQRPGFGGAFRAWMRLHGKVRPCDKGVTAVSKEYNKEKGLCSDKFKHAQQMGKFATKAGQSPGCRHGFGGDAWSLKQSRTSITNTWKALLLRAPDEDVVTQAQVLARQSSARGATVAETLSVARRGRAEATKRKRARESEELETIKKYRSEKGVEIIEAVKEVCPSLKMPLIADPTPYGWSVICAPPSDEDAKDAVTWACQNAYSSGLAVRLETHWDLLHRTTMESSCPDTSDLPSASKCMEAGVCLCSEEGKELEKRGLRLIRYIKITCPPASIMRQRLVDGYLVLRLRGICTDYEVLLELDNGQVGSIDLWLHIGLEYLNPFLPTFMEVRPTQPPGEVEADPRRTYVESVAAKEFWFALQTFSKTSKICAQWYRLEETSRPIAQFVPEPLPVLLLPGYEEPEQWWPRRLGKKKPAHGFGCIAPDGDEVEDEELSEVELLDMDPMLADPEVAPDVVGLLEDMIAAYEDPASAPVPNFENESAKESAAPAVDHEASDPARRGPRRQSQQVRTKRAPRAPKADIICAVPGGYIIYYESNGNFQATCEEHGDERCTLTRRGGKSTGQNSSGASSSAGAAPGRPLGLLLAWLSVADAHADKENHCDVEHVKLLASEEGQSFRQELRDAFRADPGAADLLACERPPLHPGEDEPRIVP
eukprot:TRINITY_DN87333_c0_g1_i1.p1 TRINITY_DN87333_c0_g1~~TRINITY_DN87333_c0_g1_i1.p1  ORF type:complete len:1612 (-),score=257.34 TRINITY_DN87333_c0_g1_i1:89-4207(-)